MKCIYPRKPSFPKVAKLKVKEGLSFEEFMYKINWNKSKHFSLYCSKFGSAECAFVKNELKFNANLLIQAGLN